MKKTISILSYSSIILLITLIQISCEKEKEKPYKNEVITGEIPKVSTNQIADITYHSAIAEGAVLADGGLQIISKGFCWSYKPNPTIESNLTIDTVNQDEFSNQIDYLKAFTTYYLKAYATNEAGTGYGEEVSFTTDFQLGEGVIDIEGNEYLTVIIGDQEWMAENLRTTTYNDGTPITHVPEGWSEIYEEAYCW